MSRRSRRESSSVVAGPAESLARLVAMHTYCRPAGSPTELAFVNEYLKPLGDMQRDRYGNYSIVVGDRPELVWSCHTDTVHHRGGRQQVELSADGVLSAPLVKLETPYELPGYSYVNSAGVTVVVPPRMQYHAMGSGCLGADDTAGVWLLCELIRRGVAGRYMFHYGEEEGCQGSRALADDCPAWIAEARYMIALDRKDTGDIITHQCGSRTASDAFARALAAQLNGAGLRYRGSDRGLYTDSESYSHLIPECTNLSIGYAGNHSQAETLDTGHCLRLLDALTQLDTSALVHPRNPVPARAAWSYSGGQWHSDEFPDDYTLPMARTDTFYYCYSCGASVDQDAEVCAECGEDDPADPFEFDAVQVAEERRQSRADLRGMFQRSTYLDPAFADVQRALGKAQAETEARAKRLAPVVKLRNAPRGVVPSRCCRWGGCSGCGPIGGHCNRCGTAIAATEARA